MANDHVCRFWRELDRVLAYAERWGVDVRLYHRYNGSRGRAVQATHAGPVEGGIHWPTRTVLFPSDGDPHALLHEVDHVLVDVDPDEVDEVNGPMLALDYHGSRTLRLSGWRSWMDGFTVAHGDGCANGLGHRTARAWPTLTTRERGDYLEKSRRAAVAERLLMPSGRPTFERRGAVQA